MNEFFGRDNDRGEEVDADFEVNVRDDDNGADAQAGQNENKADNNDRNEQEISTKKKNKQEAKKTKATSAGKASSSKASRATVKMTNQEKKEYELLRRWTVKIVNVKLQNTQREPVSCFVQFIVGGDFREEEVRSTTGKKETMILGDYGPNFKTEFVKNIEKDAWRQTKAKYEGEYQGSYLMLEDEVLTIEVWEHNQWTLNEFLGSVEIPLIEIASGNINRTDEIIQPTKEGSMKGFMRIAYTVYFQEIWDWNLTFTDWKCLDLQDPGGDDVHPKLELTMMSTGSPSLSTESYKHFDPNPHWEVIKGSMYFRGTIDELENQQLRIDIMDNSSLIRLSSRRFASRIVNMKGAVDFGKIKTFINLGLPKARKKLLTEDEEHKKLTDDKKGGNFLETIGAEEGKVEDDDEMFASEAIIVEVEGRINVGNIPRYRQRGEIAELRADRQYLIVNLLKIEKIQAPENAAMVNTFVTIEWGGQMKRTATIKDNYNPLYNQMFAFKIPIRKSIMKDENALKKFLRSELAPNNYVTFDLWLEGEGGTNDNLGTYTLPIAELENVHQDERVFRDSRTKKQVKYTSKVLEANRKLISGEDESGVGQLLFETWFLPDLKGINLTEFSKVRGDRIPAELAQIPEEARMSRWVEGLSKSFLTTPTKGRLRNLNTLYVKDQHAKQHLIAMYVSKFTMNTFDIDAEDAKEEKEVRNAKNAKEAEDQEKMCIQRLKLDRRVRTLAEIAHFVRCIPFSSDRNSEIWSSPNSITTMKQGSPLDHSLLMACLFMSCKTETRDDVIAEEKKEADRKNFIKRLGPHSTPEDPGKMDMEYRTFVCVGMNNITKVTGFWVMTLDADLKGVTFWEVTSVKKVSLRGRITEGEKLKAYLKNEKLDKDETKKAGGGGLIGMVKNIGKTLAKVGENPEGEDKERKSEEKKGAVDKKKKNKDKKVASDEEANNDDDEDINNLIAAEDNDLFEDRRIDRHSLAYEKKSVRFTGRNFLEDIRKGDGESATTKSPAVNFSDTTNGRSTTKERATNFLAREEEENERQENDNRFKRLRPIQSFEVDGMKVDPVKVRYTSIELVFNNQNIWANLQHHDPTAITYNLHDETCWKPFLTYSKGQVQKGTAPKEIPQKEGAPKENEEVWRGKLGIFYNFNNLRPPMTERELKKSRVEIIKAIRFGVENARSGHNLQTKWRKQNDKVADHLITYLRLLEYRDTDRLSDLELKQEVETWQADFKKLMPKNWRYFSLPMFFTISEPERIKSVIVKDALQFFKTEDKKAIFTIACKIFPYPGGFNSVRVILAYFTPIPEEELEEDQEEEESRDLDDIEEDLGEDEEELQKLDPRQANTEMEL